MAPKKKINEDTTSNSKQTLGTASFGRLAENTSKIVIQAVEILEEEVARGIVTAKEVEKKITNANSKEGGSAASNQQLEALLLRIRTDAHDIIVDVAAAAVKKIDKISTDLSAANTTGKSN